jgi:hydrogenase nickel incorporation protein HypA/HybF
VHELSIAQSMVQAVVEATGQRRVLGVRLEIGKLSGVEVAAIRFCFDVVAEGTPVQGAELTIEEPPGHGRCRACGAAFPVTTPLPRCACGGLEVELESGKQIRVRDVEVQRDVRDVRV